ncbi:hypothetical protein J6590_069350 [Homalodisca vitripennis]|nr:hypothetical protein J6590_069350 [Homalodisca vitripennis]
MNCLCTPTLATPTFYIQPKRLVHLHIFKPDSADLYKTVLHHVAFITKSDTFVRLSNPDRTNRTAARLLTTQSQHLRVLEGNLDQASDSGNGDRTELDFVGICAKSVNASEFMKS